MLPNLGIADVSEIDFCGGKGIISAVLEVKLLLDLLFDCKVIRAVAKKLHLAPISLI